uniref:Transforming acidic coiled-coil-containing protein C-terminal domain-containing protein n=1 Tax=Syphacia muris TaxID=451379 RepID=A0A0N5AUW5_9BILA
MDNAPRAAEPLIIRGIRLSCVHRPFIASSSHETRRTTVNATLRKSESIGNLRNDCNTSGLPNTFDPQRRQSENKLSTSDEHELKLQNSMHLKPQPNNTLKNYTKEIKQVNIENNTVNPQSADENLENLTSGLNDAKSEYAAAAQTKLLHKFEKAYQKELKETVKESNAENDESLKTAKKPENLANGGLKEKYSRDKTALIEEIVELQQRIDDITPTLALKESQIAMLENEKDAANSQVQSVKDQLQTVQVELVEAKRGEAAASKLELKRNEEIESLRQSLKKFEAEIKEYREKERSFVPMFTGFEEFLISIRNTHDISVVNEANELPT